MVARRVASLAGVLLVALGVWLGALLGFPENAAAAQPNIVLIVTDDQRADTLGYMQEVQDQLVAQGVTFDNSLVSVSTCCPSRASLLTGRYAHWTGLYKVSGFSLHGHNYGSFAGFADRQTLPVWLDRVGYRTGLFGKYLNRYGAPYYNPTRTYIPPGWDRFSAFVGSGKRSYDPDYFDYTLNVDGKLQTYGSAPEHYSTDVLAGQATSFIQSSTGPFFLYFAPFGPHAPATPAPRHAGAFEGMAPLRPPSYDLVAPDQPRWVQTHPPLSDQDTVRIDALRQRQVEVLQSVDEAVASIITALEEKGVLENTAIVFTSDNGVLWGEHRQRGGMKASAYQEAVEVPLVVRYDALLAPEQRGRRESRPVGNIDIAPTLTDLASAPRRSMEGRSLRPLLTDAPTLWRERFLLESMGAARPFNPRMQEATGYCGFRGETESYVLYRSGEEELYDLTADPYQVDNLADEVPLSYLRALRSELRLLCKPPPPGFAAAALCTRAGTARGETLYGAAGADFICGRGGRDRLHGRRGDDVLYVSGRPEGPPAGSRNYFWGAGRSRLFGGGGNDLLISRDGAKSKVFCGRGRDRVSADRRDDVYRSCESVKRW